MARSDLVRAFAVASDQDGREPVGDDACGDGATDPARGADDPKLVGSRGLGVLQHREPLFGKCVLIVRVAMRGMTHFDQESHYRSKAEVLQILARLGISQEIIAEIGAQLPDPVDLHESGALLQTYGLTRDAVISRLGGSP